ncbi:MAG TPA: MFS transporter [Acetobacteraceae bacterium]|nr:MFS transporter [Acetobacteraceae bacterium]
MSNIQTRALPVPCGAFAPRRWLALPVILAGTFMVVLDFFIVNVAIPSMQRELRAGTAEIEWVVAGYSLAYAALLIPGGRLGDIHGRRFVFALGLAAFTLASAACGLAPNTVALILARAAQGVGAALLAPQVLAILGAAYPGADRPRAFAAYGLVLGLASACGQLIGGLLIEADVLGLGWRACFLVNVPVGLLALALTSVTVPESRAASGRQLDLLGATLVTLGIVGALLPLIEGRAQGWPSWTWLCFAAAAVLLAAFVVSQRRVAAPLLDAALFQVRRFGIGLLAVLALFGGVASFFLVLALYLQQGRGLAPLPSGMVFTTMALSFSASSLAAGPIGRCLGRPPLLIGALGMALGLGALRVTVGLIGVGGPASLLVPALLIDGAGMGLVMAPLVATVLAGLPDRLGGAAAGVLAAVQQLANALGVALIGLVFFGALGHDPERAAYAGAFSASLSCLVALALALAALVWRLERRV